MAKKRDHANIGLEEGVDALRDYMDHAEEIPFEETEDEREQANGKARRKPPPPFQPVSTFRDPATIPPRRWLYGRQYIRGAVSATIADGGIGKTNLAIIEGIAIATGRNLLGVPVPEPLRVLYWNGEESLDEIERRVHAVCQHHKIDPSELTNRFFMLSGFDEPILLASMHQGSLVFDGSCIDRIKEVVTRLQIDILMLDPFVSLHRVPENDNTNIEAIVGQLAAGAHRLQIAIELDHHVRKPNANSGGDSSVADARGAGALVNKARTARVLNRMTAAQAQTAKVKDHREFFRADNGKANYAPAFAATWFKAVPIMLPNGDSVAALESWKYPNAFDAVRAEHVETVQAMVRSNDNYRADPQSPEWIGHAIADVVGLDVEADEKTIKTIIKTWLDNKVLYKHSRKDETRRVRVFITADPPQDSEQEAQERRERFRVVTPDNKPEPEPNQPFEVLGAAPAGSRCGLCGKGGAMRIKHKGGTDEWHERCAVEQLAAMTDPPVKVPPSSDEPDEEK